MLCPNSQILRFGLNRLSRQLIKFQPSIKHSLFQHCQTVILKEKQYRLFMSFRYGTLTISGTQIVCKAAGAYPPYHKESSLYCYPKLESKIQCGITNFFMPRHDHSCTTFQPLHLTLIKTVLRITSSIHSNSHFSDCVGYLAECRHMYQLKNLGTAPYEARSGLPFRKKILSSVSIVLLPYCTDLSKYFKNALLGLQSSQQH